MLSQDKKLHISITPDASGYFLQPADWSMISMPSDPKVAASLVNAYQSMAAQKHLALITCRGSGVAELQSAANVILLQEAGLQFSDSICLTYEGTTKRNGSRLSIISEHAYLFSRGTAPNFAYTKWFNQSFANATNHWDVTKHTMMDGATEPTPKTKWGNFAWEIGLLMFGLSCPWQFKAFIYEGNPNDPVLLSFIKAFGFTCYCYWKNQEDAKLALQQYERMDVNGQDIDNRF